MDPDVSVEAEDLHPCRRMDTDGESPYFNDYRRGESLRRILTVVSLVASLLMAVPALAVPSNDDLANARDIGSLPFAHSFNNTEATMEPDEPTFCNISNTVWYRWTAPSDRRVSLELTGANYSQIVAIFRGTSYDNLSLVDCYWGTTTVMLDPIPGENYLLQVGNTGWGTPGNLDLDMRHVGSILGTVTDNGGFPIEGICVNAVEEDGRTKGSSTGADGRYRINDLRTGRYRMSFYPCYWDSRYQGEWYHDGSDYSTASLIELTSAELTIDESLADVPPFRGAWAYVSGMWGCDDLGADVNLLNQNNVTAGPRAFDVYLDGSLVLSEQVPAASSLWRTVWIADDLRYHTIRVESEGTVLTNQDVRVTRCPDFALTHLEVEGVRLRTDQVELVSPGHNRLITFEMDNLVPESEPVWVDVEFRACPVSTGTCSLIRTISMGSVDGKVRGSFQWNALGYLGDVEITATIIAYDDRNFSNNQRKAQHYVIVGGSGLGVGPAT